MIGLLSLKDTNCTETKDVVEACRNGGVSVILVSRDNDQALRAIADQCGMLGPNPLVLNGKDFRDYTEEERMDKVDQISIMSNASPSDKLLFLECLKQKGHTVAFIGTRTDETPAIKHSDVGVTIGTWSTKMAKGASDIVILDGDFSFLETIIRNGRCANENIQKYIQHELTMVISGLLISSITTGLLGDVPSNCNSTRLRECDCEHPGWIGSVGRATSRETNWEATIRTRGEAYNHGHVEKHNHSNHIPGYHFSDNPIQGEE